MRAIKLDYVTTRTPSVPGLAVFVLAVLLLVMAWQYYSAMHEQRLKTDKLIQQLRKQSGIQPLNTGAQKKSSAEVLAKMQAARQLANDLQMPWDAVFNALETAALEDSALLAIEPDTKKHQLKITAEAKNKDVMFDYMQRVENTPELFGVYLLKHEIQEEVDQHPLRFVLVAKWKAAS